MTEPITGTVTITFDPAAIIDRNDAARQMVSDLCHGERDWIMSIPARRDWDPDLIISASLRDVRTLLLAYESMKEQLAVAAARSEQQTTDAAALLSDLLNHDYATPPHWSIECACAETTHHIERHLPDCLHTRVVAILRSVAALTQKEQSDATL